MFVDCEYCNEANECINCNRCEVEDYLERVECGELKYNPEVYLSLVLTGNAVIKEGDYL